MPNKHKPEPACCSKRCPKKLRSATSSPVPILWNSHQVITSEAPVLLRVTWWSEWIRVTKRLEPEKWNHKWDFICKWIYGDSCRWLSWGWLKFLSIVFSVRVRTCLGVALELSPKVKAQVHPKNLRGEAQSEVGLISRKPCFFLKLIRWNWEVFS